MNEQEILAEIERLRNDNRQYQALREVRRMQNARLVEKPLTDVEREEMMLRIAVINARADAADLQRRGRRWLQVAKTVR
jgi:hypothetical protein